MRYAALIGLALLGQLKDDFPTLKAKAEAGFAEDGLKLADELLKKGHAPEARLVAGIVATRVAASKEKAEKIAADAKAWKGKPPAGKDAETKVPAFGKKWAGEWRKVAKAATKDQAKEGARLEVEAEILDALWEHAKAYALFNRRRAEAGVPTVEYDFALAYGCQMHARYLVKNPETKNRHSEEEGKPGYSEEGKAAGENSVIGRYSSLSLTVERNLATLFHRTSILDATTSAIGIGNAKTGNEEACTIDILSSPRVVAAVECVAYPPDGASNVLLGFIEENPPPIPTDAQIVAGYPATLTFTRESAKITEAIVRVFEAASKQEVVGYSSSPEKPAHRDVEDNAMTVGFIPKAQLKPNSKYRVEVTCKVDGQGFKREWSFTTGIQKYPE